jgi:hypothetical protein
MSSLVISGDTSGSVTLQAPAVAGTTTLTLPSTSGTVMAPTSNGTSGQFLTSSGSATPTWTTPSSGAMTLISTQTISSAVSSIQFTALTGYDKYFILFENLTYSATYDSIGVQLGTGAGPTYLTSNYNVSIIDTGTSGTSPIYAASTGLNSLTYPAGVAMFSGSVGISGLMYLNGFTSTTGITTANYQLNFQKYDSSYCQTIGMGQLLSNTTIKTAIKIFGVSNASNLTSGKISLYGISS